MASSLAGRYRLIRSLAVGGMGEVFLAVQEGPAGFSRPVVVKRVLKHLSQNPAFVEMFLNEARLAALLTHPSIVQVLELGQDDEGYFIAMELVHGVTLRALLKAAAATMPPQLAAYVAAQALEALHHAHQLSDPTGQPLRLVHRDVSPDNVMLTHAGQVKLLDFGIAKAQAAATQLTRPGTVKGKYAYMPPEALTGDAVDARADVYAVGVVLQEAVSGTKPHDGPTEPAIIDAILHGEPRAPGAAVPPALAAIVRRAVSRLPQDRFPSAQAMAGELERWLKESGGPANAAGLAQYLAQVLGPDASRPLSLEPAATPAFVPKGQATLTHPPDAATEPHVRKPRRAALLLVPALAAAAAGAWLYLRPPVGPPVLPAEAPPVVVAAPVEEAPPQAEPSLEPPPPPPVEPAPAEPRPAPAAARRSKPTGKVVFRIKPWAEVFVNGQRLGVTPLPDVSLPAGNAVFTLKNAELKVSRQVTVKVASGKETVLKTDLRDP